MRPCEDGSEQIARKYPVFGEKFRKLSMVWAILEHFSFYFLVLIEKISGERARRFQNAMRLWWWSIKSVRFHFNICFSLLVGGNERQYPWNGGNGSKKVGDTWVRTKKCYLEIWLQCFITKLTSFELWRFDHRITKFANDIKFIRFSSSLHL